MDERLIDATFLKQNLKLMFEDYVIAVDERAEKAISKIIDIVFETIDACPTIVQKKEI